MSKISVVMPVYNASEYLKASIDCILNQTYQDIELVCVDDGSTDSSLEILKSIADADSRVKVFSQTNQGGGAARNFALKHVTGKYLYFMDADDILDLNAFEELVAIADEKSLDFIIFKATNYDSDTDTYYDTDYYSMQKLKSYVNDKVFGFDDLHEHIFDISVTPWCKFYNLEFVNKSQAKFLEGSIFHDNQFFWEVLFNAKRMYFKDKAYYTRRRHSASSTGAGDERYVNIINVVNNIIKLFVKYGHLDTYKNILYNKKVQWIYARYVDIHEEYRQMFYDEMKRDFTSIEDNAFEGCLTGDNRFIFESVINSKTKNHFDLLLKNHELKKINAQLKNSKKLPNFIKYRLKKIIK